MRLPWAAGVFLGGSLFLGLLGWVISAHTPLSTWAAFFSSQVAICFAVVTFRKEILRTGWLKPAAMAAMLLLSWLLLWQITEAGLRTGSVAWVETFVAVATAVLFPWGASAQALFAAATAVTSTVIVVSTASDSAALVYSLAGVVLGSCLSIVVAHHFDLHRLAIFCNATDSEEHTALDRDLMQVARRVIAPLDDDGLFDAIAESSRLAMGAAWGLIFERREEGEQGSARILGGAGRPAEELDQLRSLELSSEEMAMIDRVAAGDQIRVGDTGEKAPIPDVLRFKGTLSIQALPLLHRGRSVGVIVLGDGRNARRVGGVSRHLLEAIAEQIAVAVKNYRLVSTLREADTVKSQFLATLSHEMRTPLNVVLGYCDMLSDQTHGSLTTEQRDILERLRNNGLNLADLIAGTVEVERLEAGHGGAQLRRVDLARLISDIQRDGRNLPRRSSIELEWEIPDRSVKLHTDPRKVRVVVKSLVANALKFTERGRVVVSLRIDELRDKLELSVRDTGRGITKEELPHVFEMFRQGPGAAEDPSLGGVGLGLYIVNSFVEQLDGNITVHSDLGRGSIFRVSIPMRTAPQGRCTNGTGEMVA
jgi:signal transduction histidine kinase